MQLVLIKKALFCAIGGGLVCVYEEVEKGGGEGWLDPNIQQL